MAKSRSSGLLLAALLGGCGDSGGPGIIPPTPEGPRILFLGGSPRHLFLVYANGAGLQQLTSGPQNDGGAFWSHDGTKIYFNRDTGAPPNLYVMNADGSNPQGIASLPRGEGVTWSPDATRKAFAAYLPSPEDPLDKVESDLYVMNADSTELLRVVDLRAPWNCDGFTDCPDVVGPAWSPTGEWIAYATWMTGRALAAYSDLGIVSPDGTQQRTLVASHASAGRWSPDGRQLAYVDGDNGFIPHPRHIAVTGLSGEGPSILVDGNADSTVNFGPVWTADGSHIVFSRSPVGVPDSSEILIVSAGGGGLRQLTGLPGNPIVQDVNPRDLGSSSFP
jgi:Tol biopolymer transport system component